MATISLTMSDDESVQEKTSASKPQDKNARKKVAYKGDRAKAGKHTTSEAMEKQPARKDNKPRQKAANPVRLPQNLSSNSTPAKNESFMGESVFASDYGIGRKI